jgi:ATP-dependent exoDNAse (exonuclease V) beta subunit
LILPGRSQSCPLMRGRRYVVGCAGLQARIEAVTDDADLEEAYNTERHLLYVACTRARDWLSVSGVNPISEFLDDLACEQ